jgi:hypothetical protein
MKTVFYFMVAFVAMLFLFGGVITQGDINLNQELHGMVVKSIDSEQEPVEEQSINIDEIENHPDLIVVYPYN